MEGQPPQLDVKNLVEPSGQFVNMDDILKLVSLEVKFPQGVTALGEASSIIPLTKLKVEGAKITHDAALHTPANEDRITLPGETEQKPSNISNFLDFAKRVIHGPTDANEWLTTRGEWHSKQDEKAA